MFSTSSPHDFPSSAGLSAEAPLNSCTRQPRFASHAGTFQTWQHTLLLFNVTLYVRIPVTVEIRGGGGAKQK